jgi:DNA-binding NarL/FixJ family response regulator
MKEIIALISDDHAIVREGLRLILETFEDIAVARRPTGDRHS